MSAPPIAILGAGMMTGVGLTAPATCAAIRCAIDNFQETRFIDKGGEWILGCEVPLDQPWRGPAKLAKLLAGALRETLDLVPDAEAADIPLLLCVAEQDRPGRLDGLSNSLYDAMTRELDASFHRDSQMFAQGRVGGAMALHRARQLLTQPKEPHQHVIVAGVDSFLIGPTLAAYQERDRLLTADNSNGFIPGEAAGAVLLGLPDAAKAGDLICLGMGFAREEATVESEEPLRADGLSEAIKAALAEAGLDLAEFDFRLTDLSGEQYGFKEATLALGRVLRKRKEEFDIWHPADCIGEVGAAALPCMLAVALYAARKGYAPGPGVLCHLGNDDGKRAALVVRQAGGRA